jgi:hypothetical protein
VTQYRYDNTNTKKSWLEVNRAREACDLKPIPYEEWVNEKRFRTAGIKGIRKAPEQPKRYKK